MTDEQHIENLKKLKSFHNGSYGADIDRAIKALEQEPCEDAISRADAEALFRNARSKLNPSDYKTADEFNTRDLMLLNAEQFIHLLPSVKPQEPCDVFDECGNYKYPSDVELTEPNTATSMPCEDVISRQAVLDAFGFSEKTRKWGGDHSGYDTMMLYEIQDVIESQPPVKPQEPKTGHWIYKQYGSYPEQGDYHCSECYGIDNRIPAYCPNCGAKMKGDTE